MIVRPTSSSRPRRCAVRRRRLRRGGELHGLGSRVSGRYEGELGHGVPLVRGRVATWPRRVTGSTDDCPTDVFESSATVCRSSAGVCDVAESCTGRGRRVRPTRRSTGTVCRSAAGVCDVAEACDGSSDDCPTDVARRRRRCAASAAGVCDVAETCTARATTVRRCEGARARSAARRRACATCRGVRRVERRLSDRRRVAATVCRSAGGVCDLAENCDGLGDGCPADAKGARARSAARRRRLRRRRDVRRLERRLPDRRRRARRSAARRRRVRHGRELRRRRRGLPGGREEHGRLPLVRGRVRPDGDLRRRRRRLSDRREEHGGVPVFGPASAT
jgi:hypothetical protein